MIGEPGEGAVVGALANEGFEKPRGDEVLLGTAAVTRRQLRPAFEEVLRRSFEALLGEGAAAFPEGSEVGEAFLRVKGAEVRRPDK